VGDRLADLTGSEAAAHCRLRKLLRRQVLDDLLQRLGALDRVHGLSRRNLLGYLDRVQHLLLCRPWVLRREGCIGSGTSTIAAIACTDPSAAERAEDARGILAGDSRIEQLCEVGVVISVNPIGVKFCHFGSPSLLCRWVMPKSDADALLRLKRG
jgi:hypothetical protein